MDLLKTPNVIFNLLHPEFIQLVNSNEPFVGYADFYTDMFYNFKRLIREHVFVSDTVLGYSEKVYNKKCEDVMVMLTPKLPFPKFYDDKIEVLVGAIADLNIYDGCSEISQKIICNIWNLTIKDQICINNFLSGISNWYWHDKELSDEIDRWTKLFPFTDISVLFRLLALFLIHGTNISVVAKLAAEYLGAKYKIIELYFKLLGYEIERNKKIVVLRERIKNKKVGELVLKIKAGNFSFLDERSEILLVTFYQKIVGNNWVQELKMADDSAKMAKIVQNLSNWAAFPKEESEWAIRNIRNILCNGAEFWIKCYLRDNINPICSL